MTARRKKDINFRIISNLRARLSKAVKRSDKKSSLKQYLGCAVPELKKHLESKFQSNMSWDNYGSWHIDHIKPLSKFDLTNKEEFNVACHYTNLQPLWAKDNLKKGNQ